MARNLKTRIKTLDGEQARGVLLDLTLYLEALERLMAKSDTLPTAAKIQPCVILEEMDYLVGIYKERTFRYPTVIDS